MSAPSGDRTRLYLAYGSNLWPPRLAERIGDFETLGRITLTTWRLSFNKRGNDDSAKANLIPTADPDRYAMAALYRVSRDAQAALDRCEGRGRGYEILTVDLPGHEVPAITYVSPLEWQDGELSPYDWYRDLVVRGARYHGFPDAYVERLAAHPARFDPDAGRSRRHRVLLGG